MTKKKVYIAGKVTGEPIDQCTIKFSAAQKAIEALGFEAINPLEVVGDFNTPWNKAMRMCIAKLTECDAMVLLPDGVLSKGAKIEIELANILQIQVFTYSNYGLEVLQKNQLNAN